MGCVSSKQVRREISREAKPFNNDGLNHVVCLTSSTYGALQLENKNEKPQEQQGEGGGGGGGGGREPIKELSVESKIMTMKQQKSPPREEPEVINTWELMEDLEEGVPVSCNQPKKSPNSRVLLKSFADLDARSPLKFLNRIGSPQKARTFGGKENKMRRASDFSPRPVLKANNHSGNSHKAALRLSFPPMMMESPVLAKKTEGVSTSSGASSTKKSFSPLFDPELVALYEKELSEGEEQIKRIISPTHTARNLKNSLDSESILKSFEQKCPPGGNNSVVIYTTTLRGIRKTFEDCNNVRSIIGSHHIQFVERDVSMHSGFKEELRDLMCTKEVKVPIVFVKGRLIGGADQVVKLDEEGKLEILFDGIPKALAGGCEGCAGVRFLMCRECNGSCKVLDQDQQNMVRCGECNENGLVQCPLCC